ncbi:hypothetical protein CsSME_00008211 [Camellia sinensis var. sinensis]
MSITCNCKLIPLHLSLLPNPNPKLPFPNPNPPPLSAPKLLSIRCAKRSQRTGKYRYPSEKKKLKSRQQTQIDVPQKFEGFWRLSKLGVSVHRDPGKDFLDVSDALLEEIAKVLEFPVASMLPPEAFSVVRKSFDARKGGAGTWSDGKLVTRIGRNSCSVLAVMKTLVHFGAPKNILVDGKPHLGTDRLVPLLRNFRRHLQGLGVNIRFGTRVDDLLVENRSVVGVKISDSSNDLKFDSQKLGCDAVVLAVGHSARDIYQMLLSHDMNLCPKDFSVGLRIEHPQELINSIQYSGLATEVRSGRGKVPVADYKVVKYIKGDDVDTTFNPGTVRRGCYSFCMCPGGQVVLTSTNPSELCINGMSFSRRASKWANAALVVTVSSKDFDALNFHGPLAGVEFQREFERRAATMGGGNFVVPVQTVTDFLENKLSGASVPPSSYRLGVKVASLHELFPNNITEALQNSLSMFDKELPGFISNNALLHGVETRTSSPVQIPRNTDTYESTSLKGLYPVGEGAGYAGGIVSAAVDGMYAGFAVAKNLDLYRGSIDSLLGKAQNPNTLLGLALEDDSVPDLYHYNDTHLLDLKFWISLWRIKEACT